MHLFYYFLFISHTVIFSPVCYITEPLTQKLGNLITYMSIFEKLQYTFGASAAALAIIIAILYYHEVKQNENHDNIREWFKSKWVAIDNSIWFNLPAIIINWIFSGKEIIHNVMIRIKRSLGNAPLDLICFLFCAGFFGRAVFVTARHTQLGISMDISFWCLFLVFLYYAYIEIKKRITSLSNFIMYLLLLLLGSFSVPILSDHWKITVTIIMPFLALFAIISEDECDMMGNWFQWGFVYSFPITGLAFWAGGYDYGININSRFYIFFTNILFDYITLIVTIKLLNWAISHKGSRIFKIPIAVIADVILACIFACLSLYFAVISEHSKSVVFPDWNPNRISPSQTVNVLVGLSPDGNRFQFDIYFWSMHTAIIPTVIYLTLIMLAWVAKLILLPVNYFLGQGQANKNPLKLTAALCGIISAMFLFLAYIMHVMDKVYG